MRRQSETDRTDTGRNTTRRRLLAAGGAAVGGVLAGCTGEDSSGADGSGPTDVHVLLPEASLYNLVHYYGRDLDAWSDRGLNVTYDITGFGQYARGFTSGDVEGIGQGSAQDLAEFVDDGEPISVFAPHLNEINQVFAHADSDIESVPDLEGRTLGVAGLGSGTTRTFSAMWADMYDFDLEDDPEEVVDTDSAVLYDFLIDGEVDAVLMFTGFTVSALADDRFESIFSPVEEWTERTGHPGQVTLFGTYDEFLEENPQAVLDFWDGWVEAVEGFREDFDTAIEEYATVAGLDLDEEAELDVIQELVDDEEIFPTEWNQSVIDANAELLDLTLEDGGITGFAGAEETFITHEEIEDRI